MAVSDFSNIFLSFLTYGFEQCAQDFPVFIDNPWNLSSYPDLPQRNVKLPSAYIVGICSKTNTTDPLKFTLKITKLR